MYTIAGTFQKSILHACVGKKLHILLWELLHSLGHAKIKASSMYIMYSGCANFYLN